MHGDVDVFTDDNAAIGIAVGYAVGVVVVIVIADVVGVDIIYDVCDVGVDDVSCVVDVFYF